MPRISRREIKAARAESARRNGNRCYYCDQPMWETDPIGYSAEYAIPLDQLWCFQCTTEHIVARGDLGGDQDENIAAACRLCNQVRHEMQPALSFSEFREYVRLQIRDGTWQLRRTSRRSCRIRVKNGPLLSKLIAIHQASIDQSQAKVWIDLDDGEIANLKFASLASSLWWSAGDEWRARIFALADKLSDARDRLWASPTFNENQSETIAVSFSGAEHADLVTACKTSILRNGSEQWSDFLDAMIERLQSASVQPHTCSSSTDGAALVAHHNDDLEDGSCSAATAD